MKQALENLVFCLQLSALQRRPGIDHRGLRSLLQQKGHALDPASLEPPLLAGSRQQGQERDRLLLQAEEAYAAGIRACCLCDEIYPCRLRQTGSCPLVLYYRGHAPASLWNHPFAVTVVGTRAPTQYGCLVTRRIVTDLARQDVLIISGLARGIDALAHQTALEQGALTLAVVAQGVDQVYPPEHAGLMADIAQRGVVLSEHPPGTSPKKAYFPARNRMLSGLADVVAVMEAARRSGTLITAGFAADQGREVLAVPGSILMGRSEGCHQLLRDGAGLLESAADVLELRPAGAMPVQAAQVIRRQAAWPQGSEGQPEKPPEDERRRLRQLGTAGLSLAELAAALAWPVSRTAIWLSEMEMNGLVCRQRGRYVLTERGFFCI